MLALFKESAEAMKDAEIGALVPFYLFYNALERFLDSSHHRVILRALENKEINPEGKEDCFAVNVLKVLFLIKYVKEFEKSTLENITSLMISNIDDDRMELIQNVEDALNTLIEQTLVQKHGSTYVFLTEEEQEIGRNINNQVVEVSEIIRKASEIVFDELYGEKRYKHSKLNGRYSFDFSKKMDDILYSSRQEEISVDIITPCYEFRTAQTQLNLEGDKDHYLRNESRLVKDALIVLSSDAFMDEIEQAIKIEHYLTQNSSANHSRYKEIMAKKAQEGEECLEAAKMLLKDSILDADVYLKGEKIQVSSKDVKSKINDAVGKLIENEYNKLEYINKAFEEKDILHLLRSRNQRSTSIDGTEENALALSEVLGRIEEYTRIHKSPTIKELKGIFKKAPYGFTDEDVEWLITKLFVNGAVTLTHKGTNLNHANKSEGELVNFLTKREFENDVIVSHRVRVDSVSIKNVQNIMSNLFEKSSSELNEDALMQSFQQQAKDTLTILNEWLKHEYIRPYPGKEVVIAGIDILQKSLQPTSAFEFFHEMMLLQESFNDFSDKYEQIKTFFNGDQKLPFDEALRLMEDYDKSKNFIADPNVDEAATAIREILKNPMPYMHIYKLPELQHRYQTAYNIVLNDEHRKSISRIECERAVVFNDLSSKIYLDEYSQTFNTPFDELLKKADDCQSVADMRSIGDQARSIRQRLQDQMSAMDNELASNNSSTLQGSTPQHNSKRKKKIEFIELINKTSLKFETTDDIDQFLKTLRRKLEDELNAETILEVEL